MALKIELKRDERVMLGDCVVTNRGQRTRLVIEGKVPILREKDIMSPEQADSPAKRIYLAVQFMYTSKSRRTTTRLSSAGPRDAQSAPSARPFIDSINNRILTGELYKALKETRKLIAYEKELSTCTTPARPTRRSPTETASPRELEASLLLKAAANCRRCTIRWSDKPAGLNDALAVQSPALDGVHRRRDARRQQVAAAVRSNLTKLGVFVMGETFSLMTKPKPDHLKSIIKINRGIAAGLRGKA